MADEKNPRIVIKFSKSDKKSIKKITDLFSSEKAKTARIFESITGTSKAFEGFTKLSADINKAVGISKDSFDFVYKKVVPQFDYENIFAPFSAMSEISEQFRIAVNSIAILERKQFSSVFKSFDKLTARILPDNLLGTGFGFNNSETLFLDEGLPLAWALPSEIVRSLIKAKTPQNRRIIIGINRNKILANYSIVLKTISRNELKTDVYFAKCALEALEAGMYECSQAMSANLTDTILKRRYGKTTADRVSDRKDRSWVELNTLSIPETLVLSGVWGTYIRYWEDKGDKVPSSYSRHASAHGVTKKQYSRINSIIALGHVVALIKSVEFSKV